MGGVEKTHVLLGSGRVGLGFPLFISTFPVGGNSLVDALIFLS